MHEKILTAADSTAFEGTLRRASPPSKLSKKENIVAFLFILVPVLGFCIFTLASMLFTVKYSFEDYSPLKDTAKFVFLANFKDLFTSVLYAESFFRSIGNTLFLLLSVPLSMLMGLLAAAFLQMGKIKGSKLFQVLFYLPAVSSAVAINIVWRYVFNNEFGIINLGLGVKIAWLSDGWLVKLAIVLKNSINSLGGAMILYLAGMFSVPKDYYEAAEVDGASKVRQFFSITLPLITPMTFYLIITGLIGGLQSYADSQVFGAGVQGAQTVVYFIWERGINQSRYGLASAASILLAATIMVISVIQFRLSNKWVFEE